MEEVLNQTEMENQALEKRKPGRPAGFQKSVAKEGNDELQAMREELAAMRETLASVASSTSSRTRRKKTKEHFATLREFVVGEDGLFDDTASGKTVGIVIEMFKCRQVKDETGMQRYKGLCSLEVLDPKTLKKSVFNDVNWIGFLEHAPRVKAKIDLIETIEKPKLDRNEGGGGVQVVDRYDAEGKFIAAVETEFWVTDTINTYTLTLQEGEFAGTQVKSTGPGLNI